MSAQDTLVQRYGAPSPAKRRAIIVASTLLAVVFLGWLGWAIWGNSTPKVTSAIETFKVVDDHHVTAIVDVSLHGKDVTASCELKALAEDHSTVGEITFTPDPSTRQQTQTINTDRRATSVESVGCTAPGQDHPR